MVVVGVVGLFECWGGRCCDEFVEVELLLLVLVLLVVVVLVVVAVGVVVVRWGCAFGFGQCCNSRVIFVVVVRIVVVVVRVVVVVVSVVVVVVKITVAFVAKDAFVASINTRRERAPFRKCVVFVGLLLLNAIC